MGYEGYSFAGSWVPINVNLADPIPGGKLEIIRFEESKPSSMESYDLTRSGKFEFPVFIDEKVSALNVKIYSLGILLGEQTFYPSDRIFSGHAIMACSIPANIRLSLSRMLYPGEPILVIPELSQRLPVSSLSYDAITALVITDPGAILNPSQIAAMVDWLALGGKMILLDPLKAQSSLLEQLTFYFTDSAGEDRKQVGLGTIHVVSTETVDAKNLADSMFWKEKLGIVSITKNRRLRPGFVFGKRFDVFDKEFTQEPINAFIFYIVISWITALILCGLILKKRRVLLAVTIVCILSLFILLRKNNISDVWTHGISVHIRELVSTQNGGTLTSINLSTPDANTVTPLLRKASPFTSGISLNTSDSNDKGIIRFSANPYHEWVHTGVKPGLVIDSSDTRTLRLTGFLPAKTGKKDSVNALAKLRRFDDTLEWQIRAEDGTWKTTEDPPSEIAQDADWIVHVSSAAPDLEWLIGIDRDLEYTLGGMKWTGLTSLRLMVQPKQEDK